MISGMGPKVLGYFPEMWVFDEISMMPVIERLMDYNDKQEIIPWLAESWEVAKDGKSITFKIRKGVKFTDGSDLNAESVRWNLQQGVDTKRMQFANKVTSIEVLDNYTVKLNVTQYNNQLIHGMGWYPMFSKEAFEKNGKEWCRTNCVATGPFMVGDYKRDNYIKFVRNPNYWQKGQPYLDAILSRIIPDPVIASAAMQAGEADWWSASPQFQKVLEAQGFIRVANPKYGGPSGILPNNGPDSRFADKKLREAIEYAIDKAAIAKALGFGYSIPLNAAYPPGTWGYIETETRPYNPDKAKQLIAAAGYPNGLTVKLLAAVGAEDATTAIKQYLDAVGMTVEVDIADFGRYYGMVYGAGWPDLTLYGWGVDPNTLMSVHRHWGPEPMSNPASFVRPPEFIALCEDSLTKTTVADQIAATGTLLKYLEDEALVIPTTYTPSAVMIQPWVHTTYLTEMLVSRHAGHDWMDKH
jgi:ABC-type transport system substrate-binding protein